MFSAFKSECDDRAYKSKAQVKDTKYVKSYVQVKSIGVFQWRWPVKSSGVFAFSWRFRYFLSVMPESTSKKKIIAKTKPFPIIALMTASTHPLIAICLPAPTS
jgi:hypothetical protein